MDVGRFNSWWKDRASRFEWSAIEGELFQASGHGPIVVPEGVAVDLHGGHGLHHGGGSEAICVNGSAVYAMRDSVIRIEGPASAANLLRHLTAHVHREIARNVVLCSLLHVLSDLASSQQVSTYEELEAFILQPGMDLTGMDAHGLLPAPVTRDQLLCLTKHIYLGPGLPHGHGAPELDMFPDPCQKMTPRQMEAAVDLALGGGSTYFEGLVSVSTGPTKGHPVYVAKWSQPFA